MTQLPLTDHSNCTGRASVTLPSWILLNGNCERYSFNAAVTARLAVSFLQAGGAGLGDHQSTAVVATAVPEAHVARMDGRTSRIS